MGPIQPHSFACPSILPNRYRPLSAMSYRLLILSSIPVQWDGQQYSTMDLWAVDLTGQLRQTTNLTLICPVVDQVPSGWTGTAAVPSGIHVVNAGSLNPARAQALVRSTDVVQVHGGGAWTESRLARRLIRIAERQGVKSIVGISSNRARTALLNVRRPSSPRDIVRSMKSVARYASVSLTCKALTSRADGTFIVGEGLRPLASTRCRSLHVGTASWVQQADLVAARAKCSHPDPAALRRMCIAARLERMKGVHVGVDAAALVADEREPSILDIYGAGPELGSLQAQVTEAGLLDKVSFCGTLAYPQPFLSTLGRYGVVLLTNLNDEQPRLIFDAISQGVLPVCPDLPAYRALGLPQMLLFEPGNARALASTLKALWARSTTDLAAAWDVLFTIAGRCTLDSMHASRAHWIRSAVLGREPAKTW